MTVPVPLTASTVTEATLPVSEQFGPTIQGEGPFAGQSVQFLRLGGCNLSCSWCDTAYTWDGSRFDLRAELTPRTGEDIGDALIPDLPLVLSGGEPLLHQHNPALRYVLGHAVNLGCEIHVETNGTVAPDTGMRVAVTSFAVSPKLAHAGPHRGRQDPALHPDWPQIARWHEGVFLKVVVRDGPDVREVARWADELGWPRRRVWVMPLGTRVEDLLRCWGEIAAAAADVKINASQRLHVLAWGDCKRT